jgi:hypothetical protein
MLTCRASRDRLFSFVLPGVKARAYPGGEFSSPGGVGSAAGVAAGALTCGLLRRGEGLWLLRGVDSAAPGRPGVGAGEDGKGEGEGEEGYGEGAIIDMSPRVLSPKPSMSCRLSGSSLRLSMSMLQSQRYCNCSSDDKVCI